MACLFKELEGYLLHSLSALTGLFFLEYVNMFYFQVRLKGKTVTKAFFRRSLLSVMGGWMC